MPHQGSLNLCLAPKGHRSVSLLWPNNRVQTPVQGHLSSGSQSHCHCITDLRNLTSNQGSTGQLYCGILGPAPKNGSHLVTFESKFSRSHFVHFYQGSLRDHNLDQGSTSESHKGLWMKDPSVGPTLFSLDKGSTNGSQMGHTFGFCWVLDQ